MVSIILLNIYSASIVDCFESLDTYLYAINDCGGLNAFSLNTHNEINFR